MAEQLNKQVTTLYQHGKYTSAIPLAQRMLEIRKSTAGEQSEYFADSLFILAALHHKVRDYDEAEQLYKKSLAIYEIVAGVNSLSAAKPLGNLAVLYDEQGQYAEAERLYRVSLAIREKALGPDHTQVAASLNDFAALLLKQCRYAEAEPPLRRSLDIREKSLGPDHPDVAVSLNDLAYMCHRQGKYTEAELLYQRSLAITVKAFGPEDPRVARSLHNLAALFEAQGNFDEAVQYYRRSLAINERVLGPDHPEVAKSLGSLALVYDDVGNYAKAGRLYRRALAINEKALPHDHPDIATALSDLAGLCHEQGRYPEAEGLFKRALAIYEKTLPTDHPSLAATLIGLADVYSKQAKTAESGELYDRGLQIYRRYFETNAAYMSESERLALLGTLADVFPHYFSFAMTHHEHMPELAGKTYDLLLWEKGLVERSITAQRARIAMGDAEASKLLDELSVERARYASLAGAPLAEYQYWRVKAQGVAEHANQLERALARRSPAFADQEKLRNASWRDVQNCLTANQATVEFGRFPFFDGNRWTDKTYYVGLVVRPGMRRPQWITLGEARELESSWIADYQERVAKRPPEAENVGVGFYRAFWKRLAPYLVETKRVFVSPDGILNEISWAAVPTDDGQPLMEKYDIDVVLSTKDLLRKTSHTLTRSAVLIGNPKFNLSASDQKAAVAILRAKGAVRTSSSIEELPTTGEQNETREPVNIVTNVARRRSRTDQGGPLDPLPSTGKELRSIETFLAEQKWRVDSYSEEKALEEVIKNVNGPRLLHVATHGFFKPDQEPQHRAVVSARPSGLENPMLRSGLYLAGADRARSGASSGGDLEDGVLTAYEATGLHLQGTELVVLSACETGLGKVENAEGVFGFRRALQEVGAESVLMSMWSVPDEETQELMMLFYKNWLGGKEKHEALHAAQLEMRTKVKEYWGDDRPYYWAAFVLTGP